ncbi:hypothetical protein [Streptomyces sp. 35G-GA-8]|uniref:hypothetical protein n=1 Tax=Streptomyces sp. 35G-GA-8 TaxID=2939434 RepID=UPI00201EC6C7|nr:hypothetical protein [Streptomyces sp. 35G-GA-8]MCL7377507.1 hypothetical protein [Streptomyces sp. 35G-GA-8]
MAVPTGSLAISTKLPVPVFGIDEHPGPNGTAALGTAVLLGEVDGLGEVDVPGDVDSLGDAEALGDVGVPGVTGALGGVGVPGVAGSAKAWGAMTPRETGRATTAAAATTV